MAKAIKTAPKIYTGNGELNINIIPTNMYVTDRIDLCLEVNLILQF